MVETHTYYLLLGGNLLNTLTCFKQSLKELNQLGKVSKTSAIYKSQAWGYESNNEYKNQAVEFKSQLSPFQLLEETQAIEKKLGRNKSQSEHYEDREIDIDILFCDDKIIETKQLVIPHERLHLRLFTLEPLSEIVPRFTHPKLNKTIHQLLEDVKG